MATKRATAKVQTLERLREAGREVLLEMGVAQASVFDITARAGVATGTFYAHFPSKAAFVDSLVDELNHRLVGEILATLNEPPLPPAELIIDRLALIVVGYWARNIRAIPLFADHLARHANEQILRTGTNQEAVEFVSSLLKAVPQVELRTTPEFLVVNLVALWRASGMLGSKVGEQGQIEVARDLATATKTLLREFAPKLLEMDPNKIVEALS